MVFLSFFKAFLGDSYPFSKACFKGIATVFFSAFLVRKLGKHE